MNNFILGLVCKHNIRFWGGVAAVLGCIGLASDFETMFAFVILFIFCALLSGRLLAKPHTGPTINDLERRLRKERGQFSSQHAKKIYDYDKRHSSIWDRDDVTVDPAYSSLSSNIFHDDHN